ncbi:MAG: MFS transporter [Elusimicrobiota bacterium]
MAMIETCRRAVCVLLTGVLFMMTPGVGAYHALANTVAAPVSVNTSLGGLNVGQAGAGLGLQGNALSNPGSAFTPTLNSLGAALPALKVQTAFVAPTLQQTVAVVSPVVQAQGRAVPVQTQDKPSQQTVAVVQTLSAAARSEQGPAAATSPESDSLQTVRGKKNALGVRFKELIHFFGQPKADAVQADETAAPAAVSLTQAALGTPVAKAEPEAPSKPKEKAWGLSGTTWWFIASLLAAQLGVEALGSSMPALIQKAFGDFTIYAQIAVVSSIFGILGRQFGPMVIEKIGVKKAYVGSYLIRVASITALATLLATGNMTLPLMYVFYSANALLLGTTFTAMNSVPPLLVGQNDAALNKFWGIQHTLSEIFGILGPIATGMVVAKFGFVPALAAFPIMTLAAAVILWTTLKLPEGKDLKTQADPSKPDRAGAIMKEFFKKIGRGAKVVWSNPALRLSFLAYTLFLMLNPFLYQMLAPGYALRIIGAAAPELAPAISGWLTGLYSAGGLVGGVLMTLESRRLDKAKESGKIDEKEEQRLLRKSLLRWIVLAAGSLVFLASLAVPMPALGSLVALPAFLSWASNLTLPALALIPFGIAQVVAQFKLQSFFQARVPQKDMADAMGFLGSASLAVTTAGIMGLKFLFKAFPLGLTPFYYFGLALIPVALFALYLRWALAKQGDA